MKSKKPDIVFTCSKCSHLLFVSKVRLEERVIKTMKMDCVNCGEEGYDNWILSREGNYQKEYGKKKYYPAVKHKK